MCSAICSKAFYNSAKRRDDFTRVKNVAVAVYLAERPLRTLRAPVRTVVGYRVEGIGDRDNVTREPHLVAPKPKRIPRTVKPFVVLRDCCA